MNKYSIIITIKILIPKSKNSTFNLFNSYPNSKDAMPITDGKGHIENRQV